MAGFQLSKKIGLDPLGIHIAPPWSFKHPSLMAGHCRLMFLAIHPQSHICYSCFKNFLLNLKQGKCRSWWYNMSKSVPVSFYWQWNWADEMEPKWNFSSRKPSKFNFNWQLNQDTFKKLTNKIVEIVNPTFWYDQNLDKSLTYAGPIDQNQSLLVGRMLAFPIVFKLPLADLIMERHKS